MTWVLAAYLGVGFLAGLIVTTEEGIAYIRSDPQVRRDERLFGRLGFFVVLLIAVLVLMLLWPIAFFVEDDDA